MSLNREQAIRKLHRMAALHTLGSEALGDKPYIGLLRTALEEYLEAALAVQIHVRLIGTLLVKPYHLVAPSALLSSTKKPVFSSTAAVNTNDWSIDIPNATLLIYSAVENNPVAQLRVLERIEHATQHCISTRKYIPLKR